MPGWNGPACNCWEYNSGHYPGAGPHLFQVACILERAVAWFPCKCCCLNFCYKDFDGHWKTWYTDNAPVILVVSAESLQGHRFCFARQPARSYL
jgi:hypothetical protein